MTWLTTREAVRRDLELEPGRHADARIDAAIQAASVTIEQGLLLGTRSFRPTVATRSFRWPHTDQPSSTWRIFLDADLITATTVTAGGTVIPSTDYFLEPVNSGPPYTVLEIDRSSPSALDTAGTPQRAVTIAGLWGYRNDERAAGQTDGAVAADDTTIPLVTGERVEVGDVLRLDTERVQVIDRAFVDTGETITADVAELMSAITLTLSDGTVFAAGERIRVGTEIMEIESIVGNTATVHRAQRTTLPAAHTTGTAVYADRSLTVERGVLGTTAASHLNAPVWRHVVPADVAALAVGEAIVQLGVKRSGYTATVNAGQRSGATPGVGLDREREAIRAAYLRRGRTRAVGR